MDIIGYLDFTRFSRRLLTSTTGGGHAASQVIRLASNLLMTRLLYPEMFGLMAIAIVLIIGINMLSDLGLRQNIVQSPCSHIPLIPAIPRHSDQYCLRFPQNSCFYDVCVRLGRPLVQLYSYRYDIANYSYQKNHYMKLSYFTQGRDNNFNLIRFIASLSVLITHSFALALGTPGAEPFRKSLGMTIGEISVDVFFITSGFLVTASLLYRKNTIEFIWARFLRIFPALLVMLLLTVLVVGPVFTTLPLSNYLTHKDTFRYFAKCLTLFFGVEYTLPGVFNQNALMAHFGQCHMKLKCTQL